MPSLSSLMGLATISNPKSVVKDIKGQINYSIKSAQTEIRNIPAGLAHSAIVNAKGVVQTVVGSGLSTVTSALHQAVKGDFSGALGTLTKGPQNIMSALGVFGESTKAEYNPLAGALGRSDPLMSYQWFVELPAIVPVGSTKAVTLPWNFVEEATVSFREFETRQIYAQGRQHKFASTYTVQPLRMNFYADVEGKSLAYLMAWQQAILAPFGASDAPKGGGFGRPAEYQKPLTIYMLSPDNSKVAALQYIDAWPTNLDQLNLDSATSTRLTFNVTFDVGDVFPIIASVNNNAAGSGLIDTIKKTAIGGLLKIIF